jgi:hypothetical protein
MSTHSFFQTRQGLEAEHPGIYHREATERRCAGRALQPADVAAQLHWLPLQAQGPQRCRQPAPLPVRNHRGMPVIIIPSISYCTT